MRFEGESGSADLAVPDTPAMIPNPAEGAALDFCDGHAKLLS